MLTTHEAAERLGVSERRVTKLIESGSLSAQKFGRAWMIDEASVAKRLERKPQAGRPPIEQKPDNARYILMCHDHEVLAFTCNLVTEEVRKVEPLSGIDWKPLGIGRLDRLPDQYNLREWLVHRIIPQGRPNLRRALREIGFTTPLALMLESGGASLTDPYWFMPLNGSASWEEVNCFANGYDNKLGNLLLDDEDNRLGETRKSDAGSIIKGVASSTSPDVATNGQLAKRWIRRAGIDYLVKGGTGNENREPYNELLATRLASRILEVGEYMPYELINEGGRAYSLCANMADETTELVPAHDVLTAFGMTEGRDLHRGYLDALHELGVADAQQLIDKMIVIDHLMANFDRHTHNFGLLRNVEERDSYRIAPLFDHGCGFYSRATTAELEARPYAWTSNPFSEYPSQQLALVNDITWYDPTMLDGFLDDIDEILGQNPEIDERFIAAVKRQTARQIDTVNGLAAERGVTMPGW